MVFIFKKSKMADFQNGCFSKSPILKIFLRKLHRLVLGIIGLMPRALMKECRNSPSEIIWPDCTSPLFLLPLLAYTANKLEIYQRKYPILYRDKKGLNVESCFKVWTIFNSLGWHMIYKVAKVWIQALCAKYDGFSLYS